MAPKRITLELDAYDKLVRARRDPKESFTNVVRRARWADAPPTAGEILAKLDSLIQADSGVLLDPATLDDMAARRRTARTTSRWEQP